MILKGMQSRLSALRQRQPHFSSAAPRLERRSRLARQQAQAAQRDLAAPRFIQHKSEAFWFYRFLRCAQRLLPGFTPQTRSICSDASPAAG